MKRVFRSGGTLRDAVLFNPQQEIRHLNHLAWASATIRLCEQHGMTFTSERQQFLALYESKKAQLGVPPRGQMSEELRDASRAIWRARGMLVS